MNEEPKQSLGVSGPVWIWIFVLFLVLGIATARVEGSSRAPMDQPNLSKINRFWQKTLANAAKEPLDARAEKIKAYLPYFKYRITYHRVNSFRPSSTEKLK